VELLMALANHVAIAIENTQLYETQRQQADELARIHRASDTLFFSATADLPTLAQNIVQAVLKEFGQANCSLLLLNPITDELERIGVAGPYISQVIRGRLSLNGPGLVPRAVRTGQIVNVPDVSADSDYVANWDLARSEMAVPLWVGDRIIGALDVQSSQLAAFGPIDERLLDAFAGRAALALENARLYQESQQRQTEATALYKATQPIESLDLPSVLKALAERASALTDLPHCVISLLEPERTTARIVAVWGFPEEQAQTLLNRLFSASDHPASWQKVFVEQRPFVASNTTAVPFQEQGDDTNQPPRSVLIAPLMVSDRLIGSLQLTGQARALPDDLVRRVETFATQAAITIENARLYEAVQEYARWLQIASWEREQLLEKVQQHAATLEQQVAARTAEIFAEKEKIEAILKSAGDAIVITDPEGRISYVNIAFTALTGYTIQEMAHYATITELFNDQTPPATFAGLKRSVAQGAPWRGDVNVRHRDGHAIEANMTLAPVRDENDRLINLVGSLRDVSQTRALERAKSEFLTNVSHQLRTPVTNLKTFAFLLSKRAPQDRARYVQTILDETEKLSHLVQDLLQIAELDAGPIIADWKPFSPLEIVTSTFTRHQSQAEAAGLSLSTQVPSDHLPPVLGSKYRLAQALNQIVENALAFTTQGEVVIGIQLDIPDESETPEMVLWVSDTGPGIPPKEQNHIFERFFRGQVAQPGHISGTGLGLAMARMIVEAHGGRIVVQSAVGQGSTFEIRLPVLG
jgi:PAS domain S-box-containing protein